MEHLILTSFSYTIPWCRTHLFVRFLLNLMTLSFIMQMYDILVVNKNYDAEGPDSISVRVGDLVEVLETGATTVDEPNAK